MVDIARLGFSADTGGLDTATAKLQKLVPVAKTAEAGIKGFVAAVNGVAGATGSLGGAAAGVDRVSKAALGASTAMGTVQRAAVGASGAIQVLGMASKQYGPSTAMWEAYKAQLNSIPAAAQGAQDSLQRLGAAANDNINRMQSTPGNIAAQFQDIGVTAAGGMSPLIIGLQQGTQLSAALAGGLGNLVDALRQVFSVTAILTISLVALVAYMIQMADWAAIGKSALEGLASAMQAAAPYALALGAVLLLAFAPQIIAAIYTMVVAIGTYLVQAIVRATVALFALAAANPFAALILGVAALITAFVYFGVVTIEQVKKPINFIIGGFIGAFNTIKKTWSMLPAAIGDAAVQAANSVIRTVDAMVNSSIEKLNGLIAGLPDWLGLGKNAITFRANSGQLKNNNAGANSAQSGIAKSEMGAAQSVDYVGKAQNAVVNGVGWVVDKIKGLAAGIGAGKDDKKKKGGKGDTDSAAEGKKTEAEKQAEAFDKLKQSTESYITSKNSETAAIGLSARAGALLKHQTDLTNQAIEQGIPLDEARKKSITAWATAMSDADMKLANAQGFDKLKTAMTGIDTELKAQMDQVGMTAEQTAKYKHEVVWLKDALAGLTEASPAQIAALRAFAEGAATSEIKLVGMRKAADDLKKSVEFARGSAKSFIDDMRSGLERGKGFWGSFTSAVMGMLDRLIDKLIDVAIKAAFPDNGKDGLFAGITKLFGAVSGVPSPTAKLGTPKNAVPFAKGGIFGGSGIVNSPTLFKFAKGTGLMGEAGPEAIMPLKRGADGSLGVMMHGARGGGSQEVNVNVSTSKYLIAEIDNRAGAVAAPMAARAAVGGAAIAQDRMQRRSRNRIPS